jgi:cell division protein FtsA
VDDTDKGKTVTTSNELGLGTKAVNVEHLRRIMALRLEEILQLIEQQLGKAGFLDYLRAGVVLCGGGARIPGIQKMAENIFQMPALLGKTNCVSGLRSALDQPEFATGIGLVKFGSFQQKKKSGGALTRTLKDTFKDFWRRE